MSKGNESKDKAIQRRMNRRNTNVKFEIQRRRIGVLKYVQNRLKNRDSGRTRRV